MEAACEGLPGWGKPCRWAGLSGHAVGVASLDTQSGTAKLVGVVSLDTTQPGISKQMGVA